MASRLVIPRAEVDRDAVLEADQVLVGRNKTRVAYNDRLRELKSLPRARTGGGRPAGVPAQQPGQEAAERPDLDRRRSEEALQRPLSR